MSHTAAEKPLSNHENEVIQLCPSPGQADSEAVPIGGVNLDTHDNTTHWPGHPCTHTNPRARTYTHIHTHDSQANNQSVNDSKPARNGNPLRDGVGRGNDGI